jgi:hypothetical protein
LPVGDSRQYEASSERFSAAWIRIPSGARGPAVAYAEGRERMFRDDECPMAGQRLNIAG